MIRVLLLLALLILAGGCSVGGVDLGSSQPADGGFTGRSATLYTYSYSHCYTFARKAATAHPAGSGPPIYPLSRARPLVAIGKLKPHGAPQMRAVVDGCAAAMVKAFADVLSPFTVEMCRAQAEYLPPDTAACRLAS